MRLAAIACAAALAAFAPAQAQVWPDRPVKLIVSFAPGGVHDTLARVLQPRLTEALRALPYDPAEIDPSDVMSRLIFRSHPDMVRGAWVRGRRLAGPRPAGSGEA